MPPGQHRSGGFQPPRQASSGWKEFVERYGVFNNAINTNAALAFGCMERSGVHTDQEARERIHAEILEQVDALADDLDSDVALLVPNEKGLLFADYLGVSRNTLRNWGRDGRIKEHRHPINNYRLYKRDDLDRLLREAEVSGGQTNKPR